MEEQTLISGDSSETSEDSVVELEGCGASACCNPRSTLHRFIALFFMCLLGFGSYFCYDNPGALQDYLKTEMPLSTTSYTLLYSIYSWPNVILCFVGGVLLDSVFGISLGTNIYMALVLLGQCIFAAGGLYDAFWLMLVGRFIFGIGAESLAVAQNTYAVLWFKGKELNMVFGLQLSFARVGSTVNFLTMEPLYKFINQYYQSYECIGVVLYIAALTCVMSMICSLVLGCMDRRAARILRRNENSTEVVHFRDVKDFKATFWMLTVICVAYYMAIFPFIGLGKIFFMTKFGYSSQDANTINSMVYIISAVASPIFGLLVDKTGRNLLWLFFSILFTTGSHVLLNYTMYNPYIGMLSLGIAYSLCASALWPLVALIIPEYQLGTAYGICQSVQNLGLAIVTIVAGIVVDSMGYFWLENMFIGFLIVSLIATISLWIMDNQSTGVLNMTPYEREVHDCNRLAAEILEREKLLQSSRSNIGPNDLLQPTNSEFHIRNRYLSRIGASLPSHYNVNHKYLAFRPLR